MEKAKEADKSHVNKIEGWRKVVLWPMSVLLRLWYRSLKVHVPPDMRELFRTHEKPMVLAFWHNRLFSAPLLYILISQHRRMTGMISASKDGAWLATVFSLVGVDSRRGSSSRRTMAAVKEMVNALKEGSDLAMAPDGPRGPQYVFKEGTTVMARLGKAPLLLFSTRYHNAWRLSKSWDGFYLPKPFSRVDYTYDYVPSLESLGFGNDVTKATEVLQKRLRAITYDTPEGTSHDLSATEEPQQQEAGHAKA